MSSYRTPSQPSVNMDHSEAGTRGGQEGAGDVRNGNRTHIYILLLEDRRKKSEAFFLSPLISRVILGLLNCFLKTSLKG